ncbi:MFS transporter protein [Colletotrichum tofieldiae]|nr:MFS transporter protein [Colletotrichum tofieldiae]
MASEEQRPDAEDRYEESPEPQPEGVPARSATTATAASNASKKPAPKPNLMVKLGLDAPTIIIMFKGSLPPLIGIAIYQSTPVAQYFTTLGYLVPIISVLALAILPRGKYLQNLVLNVTGILIGGGISMLALWSGVQARRNTASAEELATGLPVYNSSQSAVCGVWLFFNIWISNTLRAKYPAMNLPVMIYSIFMNVACTFGPLMVTTASAESFVRRLLVAMLCAMGIATGVSLFVFPVSSRKVVSGEFKGAIGLVRKSIRLQLNYLQTLSSPDMLERHQTKSSNVGGDSDIEKTLEKKVWNEIMQQLREPFEILTEAMDQGLDHVAIVLELVPRPKKAKAADVEMEAGAKASAKPGEVGFAEVLAERVQDFNDKKGEMLRTWLRERQLATELERRDLNLKRLETRMKERDQTQLYVMLYMEKLMLALGEAVQDLVMFADSKVADGTMARKRLIVPSQKRLKKWFKGICSTEDASPEQTPDIAEMGANVVYAGDGYNKKKDPEHLPARTAWQHFGNYVRRFSGFVGSGESLFGFRVAIATMTIGIMAFLQSTQTFFNEQRLVWAMIMIAIGMTITAGQSIFGFVCRVGGTCVAVIFSYIIWYIVVERTAGVIVFLWLFIFVEQYFVLKYPRFMPVWLITIITQVLIIGYELQVQKIGEAAAAATGQPYYPTYLLAPYRLACVAAGCAVAFIWTIFPAPMTDRRWLRRDLSASLYLLANYFSVVTETIKATMEETHGDIKKPGTPAHKMEKERRRILGKLLLLLPSLDSHAHWQKWEPDIGGKFPRATYEDIIRRSTSIMRYLTLIAYTITWKPRDRPSTPTSDSDRQWLRALNQVLAGIEPTQHTILSTLTLLSNSLLSGQSLPPFMQLPRPNELTRKLLHLRGPEPEQGVQRRGSELEHRLVTVHTSTGSEVRSSARKPSIVDSPASDTSTIAGMSELTEMVSPLGSGSILDVRNVEQHGYTEFAVLQVCSSLVCDDLEGLVRSISSLVGVVDFSFRVNPSDATLSSTEEEDTRGKGKRD